MRTESIDFKLNLLLHHYHYHIIIITTFIMLLDKKNKTKSKKNKKNIDNDDNNDNDDDEKELLLAGTRSKKERDILTPEQRKVHDNTRRAIAIYSRCLCIHALLIEGPLCIIEGIIRIAIFLTLGIIILIVSLFTLKWLKPYGLLFIKESLLTLSAILTITLLPGSVMLVYRWYHDENDWDLAPIPTIMGWVDARRFITFTNGTGSLAKNVKVKDKNKSKNKSKKNNNNNNEIYSNLLSIDHKCQDSYSKGIIFAPRVVSSLLLKISKGEEVDIPFLEINDDDDNNNNNNNNNNNDNNNENNDSNENDNNI